MKTFVSNFEVLANAAGGILQLKSLITRLALSGALTACSHPRRTPSEPQDEFAGLGSLPSSWRWVKLASLIEWGPKNGYSPKAVDYETSVRTLTLTATTSGRFDGRFFKYIAEAIPRDSDLWLTDGDILVQRGNTIDYVGTAAVYRGPGHTFIYPDLMMKLRPSQEVDVSFLHLALNGPTARQHLVSRASGTSGSMPKINQATLLDTPIPLPPLRDQRQIVAEVDRLTALCDDLQARQIRKNQAGARLTESALEALTTAGGVEAFDAAWERVFENFEVLIDRAEMVGELRRALLALALQGRLSRRERSDESVLDLLRRVTTDHTWRVEERPSKIKVDPKIEALVGVTRVPAGWAECRLNDFAQLINGRAYAQPELLSSGTPVIRIQNLNGGKDWYYSDLALPDRQYCDTGDLLFAWSASFGPYIWAGGKAIYHYHIWKLNLSPAVDKRFLYFSLLNITEVVREQSHGLAMLHMTKGQMERWPILLPPVAEQLRIVAKLEQLMKVCDDLEGRLHRAEDRASKFVEAAVRELGS